MTTGHRKAHEERGGGRRGRDDRTARGARRGTSASSSRRRRREEAGRRRKSVTLVTVGLLLAGVCATAATAWSWHTDRDAGPKVVAQEDVPEAKDGSGLLPEAPASPRAGEPTVSSTSAASPSASGKGDKSGKDGKDRGAAAKGDGSPAPGSAAQQRRTGGPLPFDMPDRAALRAKGKLVFAHYFTPYPLSLDNASPGSDYYARNYLNPQGESGKHSAYGGLLRDRPMPTSPKPGDWELANLKQEVRTARDAGLDGFTLDMLSLSGKNWERSKDLLAAAGSVDSSFKIMLMPDMSSLSGVDPKDLADAVAELGKSPAAHRLGDGRLVVSPFKAEAKSVSWWTGVLDDLRDRHGVRVAFVPLFIDFGAHGDEFMKISYGLSDWGTRSYTTSDGGSRDAQRAHSAGKIWMQPVSIQDARPNQGIYDEAGNTANLRNTWNSAIESGADWVQLTTWNDFSEGTHFAPSLHNGHSYLDLSSYYLTRFKTGSWPKIVRDTLYVSSRTQFAGADPTGSQTKVMSLRQSSASPRDQVEVVAFLTRPATVRTTVGSATTSTDMAAGVHTALAPLRTGSVSAQAVRGGSAATVVRLPYRVQGSVEVQDLQYYAATSGR
ncbi:glycoside hydrolase family 71 protein [Streptomyces sp. MUM 203J]|uniref:glycoside hydrolase family 71 protein n=1 Tax=Streptomyces sp. MUM 203J TaxID=2791990 RepID=UPI001F03E7F0|nr:glycoside hydrolase family 71 protein [Streptomyces sp. MUM 203J]